MAETRTTWVTAGKDVITVYPDRSGEWRWHRRSTGNHEIISESGESYVDRAGAIEGAHRANPDMGG